VQIAAHQAHQLATDRQAEPGAFRPLPQLADLLKRLEDLLQLVGRDPAAGVGYLEANKV
jgi:hypothetical protein